MKILVFDLLGPVAHFRRPDTTATHATYPFITRTALRGLVGAILGLEEFLGEAWTGIQLLSPVQTSAQEMSMLGKGFLGGGGDSFNRPTSIELIVNPRYRIYYSGIHQEELTQRIREGRSQYHTYLGSAFALTTPRFVAEEEGEVFAVEAGQEVTCLTVVPTHGVEAILPQAGEGYGRVGGMQYQYLGDRRFQGTINLLYEVNGKPLRFLPKGGEAEPPLRFVRLTSRDEVVCLW